MARPLKDTETNRPAVAVTFKLTEPRLEWLKALAERRNESLSEAVEHLIDRARGYTLYLDSGEQATATVNMGLAASAVPSLGLAVKAAADEAKEEVRKRAVDPKAGVAPIPKKKGDAK